MTDRAWLAGELGSAAVFAAPTVVLTTAGAGHVTHSGEPWALVQAGWRASAVAAAAMSLLSVFALWSFARQGDVHWSLWAMWIAAALAPSRRSA